jgi:NAD(P)-dependent dehydrogenase (short-subunit alcohol dehydrogenase family)
MLLEDKNAIITGAGSGVGRASALLFAQEGAKVVCADLDADAAKETARLVEDAGGTAVPFAVDVSKEDEVTAAIAAVAEHTVADFERLFAVNVGGVFYGCKHALLRFKEQGTPGAIVNTGSVAGLVGWGGSVYGATKGAVHQLTKAVAIEAAPVGVRVNAICPAGMPYTGFMAAGGLNLPDDAMASIADTVGASHPLGRPITAEDCAAAAAFLASDRAINITGVLLPVDGGYVAR